ncbi:MAG TPA: hypothetical protein VFH28_07530 [Nitrososphaera sp.]|jgi:hypothetical protein|nr:hypothetical protein [Nitrososphaera sp.]
MNIVADLNNNSTHVSITAKTCVLNREDGKRKVVYAYSDYAHSLFVDKREMLLAQLISCKRLLKYTTDTADRKSIEREIAELNLVLDLMT